MDAARRVRPAWLAVILVLGGISSVVALVAADESTTPFRPDRDGLYAVFETSLGTVVCRLEHEKAPVTVGNFVGLAEGTQLFRDPRTQKWVTRPFYDGLKFHRVVAGYVVQGGDPLGDGTGGPGYEFIDEFHPDLRHDRPGILSMANSGPGTNGSQFFMTLAPQPDLDHRFTIFGSVVQGMNVLERMTKQPMMGPQRSIPISDIRIDKLTILRQGSQAQAFDAAAAFAMQETILAQRESAKKEAVAAFHQALTDDLRKAVKTRTGLQYVVRAEGNGDRPQSGDKVVAHYIGYLEDGTRFDSSYDRGTPLRFSVGNGSVIAGWDEMFMLMKVGGKCRVVIPPDLAYGARGKRKYGIPPHATLVFDVELLEIESAEGP